MKKTFYLLNYFVEFLDCLFRQKGGILATLYILWAAMVGKGPSFFPGGVDIYKNIQIFILFSAEIKREQLGSCWDV
jgi:hypothetical protein